MYLIISLFLLKTLAFAQDEYLLRDFILGPQEFKKNTAPPPMLSVVGPIYELDWDGDGILEQLRVEFRDGNWFISLSEKGQSPSFEGFLKAKHKNAKIYKIGRYQLDTNELLYLIWFYEGGDDYVNTIGSTRLYFLTIDDHDLSKSNIHAGPEVFREEKTSGYSYFRRNYKVEVVDLDGDGKREVVVTQAGNVMAYLYQGKGGWARIR